MFVIVDMGISRGVIVLTIFIFLLINISASCDEGQIDINTASAEELDEIVYIGPARAEQIIALRPFDSVDDMVRINGIGEVYLSAIKNQGLACVSEENEEEEEVDEEYQEIEEPQVEEHLRETTPIKLQTIDLNPKVIKSEDDNENLSKSNYAIYGLVFFCVLLVVLFVLRKKKYHKNEFR